MMALSHPVRVRILKLGLQVETISASELAQALDAPLGVVSYHVRMLHRAGLLEPAGSTPMGGSVRHSYRLQDPALTAQALVQGDELGRLAMPADVERERTNAGRRKRLGSVLAARREAAGVSQLDLATRVGISATTLSRIERGDSDPAATLLCRLADELHAEPGEILTEAMGPAT